MSAGLGIGASATGDAIAKLPKTVTLAFTPLRERSSRWVGRARSAGHEILLQLPMEPFDYPDNDPGPQTLLTNFAAAQNIDRLHWFLSRFQGYVGVTNFMGGRFTSNDPPSLRCWSIFHRAASSTRRRRVVAQSRAKVATATKAPFLKADLVSMPSQTGHDIDAALDRL